MNIKGIIFDKDGTLFDFQKSWGDTTFNFLTMLSDGNSNVLVKLADILNFDLNQKLFYPESIFIAGTTDETMALLQPIIPKKSKATILAIQTYCYANQKQIPVKNLVHILQNLYKTGYSMSVATNDLEKPTLTQLRNAKILNFFSAVIGADSGFGAKPEPSQLIELKIRTQLKSEEIVMVGDSTHDMIAAKNAGFRSFGVLTGVASRCDLKPYSDVVFKDISYLSSWLKKQNTKK